MVTHLWNEDQAHNPIDMQLFTPMNFETDRAIDSYPDRPFSLREILLNVFDCRSLVESYSMKSIKGIDN